MTQRVGSREENCASLRWIVSPSGGGLNGLLIIHYEKIPMNIAERFYETVKNMPEVKAAEVLDFAEYVKARHPAKPWGAAIKNLLAAMPDVGEDDDFARPLDSQP